MKHALPGSTTLNEMFERRCSSSEVLILRALMGDALHAWMIGARMRSAIRSANELNNRSMHLALLRLQAGGWIDGEWRDVPHERRMKYYWLTSKAASSLEIESEYWRTYVAATGRLFAPLGFESAHELLTVESD